MRLHRLFAVACLLGIANPSAAQTPPPRAPTGSIAVVIADAPIMLLPDATRVPLRVAAKGTTLVIDRDGPEWIQVTFKDPQLGLRQGYIQAKFVQRENPLAPQDLSVPGAKPTTVAFADRRVEPQEQRPLPTQPVVTPGRTPMPRHGFWFSVGLGYGALTCESCDNSYLGGLSGGLSLGATLNNHLLFGVGTTGWTRTIDGVGIAAGTVDARFRIYPSAYHGFHVNAGAGIGHMTLDAGNGLSISDTGFGLMYGVGWDIKTGRNVSVTPFWNGSGLVAFDEAWGFGQLGVGITIH